MPRGAAGEVRGFASAGHYIQGPGAIRELPDIAKRFGRSAMMLIDSFFYDREIGKFQELFFESGVTVHFQTFLGECSEEEIEKIRDTTENLGGVKMLIGFGGGKTLDTARVAAFYLNLPMILVPTAVASNAATSGLSVIYDAQHRSKDVFLYRNPEYILADTNYIIAAPARMLAAGIGDSLATYFEARNNWRANNINTVMPGYRATLCGRYIAKACRDTLLEYGKWAYMAAEKHLRTEAFENVVEAVNLLSGIGWENNGCSITHGLAAVIPQIEDTKGYLHGECVALCVLIQLILDNENRDEFDRIYQFCKELHLPLCFGDIGITEQVEEKARFVAERACETQGIVRIADYEINPEKIYHAIMFLNALSQ